MGTIIVFTIFTIKVLKMIIIFLVLLVCVVIFTTIILIHVHKVCKANTYIIKNNINKAKSYLSRIENANSLDELYCIFREMINSIDVSFILNPYGMFRANSLEECRTTDIFLGDINGLWTFTLNRWMQTDDTEAVKIVTNQFKSELINTLNTYINHEKSK